jgi:hypothetical protein
MSKAHVSTRSVHGILSRKPSVEDIVEKVMELVRE